MVEPAALPGHDPARPLRSGGSLGWLPRGRTLSEEDWNARHRVILVVLWAHVPALIAFGLFGGYDPWITKTTFESFSLAHTLLEGGAVAIFAAFASASKLHRRLRAVTASIGLVSASAVLTHMSGGFIEAHFHFFVVIGVIAMYLDWMPFLVAIGYVALHHGTAGTLDPSSVYNHPAAIAAPWNWAFIHATFILGLSAAQVAHWRLAENDRDRTDSVLNAAGEAIVGLDDSGRITFSNPAAAELLGTTAPALLGKHFPDAVPLAAPKGATPLATVADGQPRSHGDDVLQRSDGSTCPVGWTSAPINRRGRALGVVVTLRDLTDERRAMEEKIRQQRTRAELDQFKEQDAFKTRFMNTAAHELNTPLTPVNIQLRLLRRSDLSALSPKQRESFEILDRNIGRFGRLIQDLLDSTRIQAGQLGVSIEDVDIGALIDEAVQSFRGPAQERGILLEALHAESLVVPGDRHRLTQVLYNLLNNALKFTPEGGTVRVVAQPGGEHVQISVQDTGIGLTAEQTKGLFQPFGQVHSDPNVTNQGSGLGLYLSKAIIDLHEGHIAAASPGPGQGTRLVVRLPVEGPARRVRAIVS